MRKLYFSFLTAFLISVATKTSAQCFQNFDAVVAPALPAGWTAITNISGGGSTPWVTSGAFSFNAPNSVFTNNATDISDEWLTSEPYSVNSASAILTFRNRFDLEDGFDGMVLEISIGGGPFQDILLAGGVFVSGGYTGTISTSFGNPIGGRQAWTGTSGGFVSTTINLPAAANGQIILLRWRRATDDSFGNTGAFIDNIVICGSSCSTVPPSISTDPTSVILCAGSNTSFSVAATGTAITYQWQINTGGGFTAISNGGVYSNATTQTLNLTAAPFALNGAQYRVIVTGLCNSVTSAAATLTLNQALLSNVIATPSAVCSPGATLITGTASGTSTGNYTHALTGAGIIVQNPPTGVNNANARFSVTAIPAGNQNYVLTSTDASGCSASSTVSIVVNATPVITFTQTPSPLCNGQIQQITPTVVPPTPQTFSQGASIIIPDGQPVISTGIANPYPSQITITGLPATAVTVKSVKLGNVNHTFPDDMDIVLVSPSGQAVILMSDAGGGPDVVGLDYTFDDAAATTMADNALNPQGTYKPTNFGVTDNFPLPGPGSLTQATPTLATFTGNLNGNWGLYIVDDVSGDFGFIGNWSITFNTPTPIVLSPVTNLFTDAAATIPYTGTPIITSVYSKPSSTITYTATGVLGTCTGTANVTVTVNQLPVITTQPTPSTGPICPGSVVTYTIAATGTGITYQWRKGGVALVNGVQASGSTVAGATTNSITLSGLVLADAGTYDVVVSGACTPVAISSALPVVISSAPIISTQPANAAACAGASASFNVATTGSVPAPTLYQWQVSTTAVPAFINITVGTFASPTLTVSNVNAAMNGNKYRVIVTNACGQNTITNGAATLTINASPVVTATALSSRICLTDGIIPLAGLPVGGSWSGIGVSGFNFVPTATAVGTYTLSYTYSNNLGCAATATTIAKVEDCPERIRLLRDNALVLYPNPNNGKFNIRVNSSLYNYVNMKVFTTNGNLVSTRNYTGLVFGQVVPVDLSYLPSGIYMVRFFYDGGVRTSEKVFPVIIGRQ